MLLIVLNTPSKPAKSTSANRPKPSNTNFANSAFDMATWSPVAATTRSAAFENSFRLAGGLAAGETTNHRGPPNGRSSRSSSSQKYMRLPSSVSVARSTSVYSNSIDKPWLPRRWDGIGSAIEYTLLPHDWNPSRGPIRSNLFNVFHVDWIASADPTCSGARNNRLIAGVDIRCIYCVRHHREAVTATEDTRGRKILSFYLVDI